MSVIHLYHTLSRYQLNPDLGSKIRYEFWRLGVKKRGELQKTRCLYWHLRVMLCAFFPGGGGGGTKDNI